MKTILYRLVLLFLACSIASAQEQVTELKAWHRQGQTFLTWKEVAPPDLNDEATCKQLRNLKRAMAKTQYFIYRSDKPITSLEGLTRVGQARQLSGWNSEFYGRKSDKGKVRRWVVKDGEAPVPPGTGIYVHNPRHPPAQGGEPGSDLVNRNKTRMKAYYAVTYSKDGKENKTLGDGNTLRVAVEEIEGQGVPVLQREVKPKKFQYINGPTLHYYARWESPPNFSVESFPIDYLVAIPPKIEAKPTPVGLHLHCWGGSLNSGYGYWFSCIKKGTAYLISSNQIPYDWWTGFNEKSFSPDGFKVGPNQDDSAKHVVRPYSTTRMLSFLDWAAKKYDLDLTRAFTAGNSMGGSGSNMFAVRYAERIAWSVGWVGVHDAGNSRKFTVSYEKCYGKKAWNPKFEDGTPAFDYYKDAWYLRKHPRKEIGFITWSNGKNDSGIGWPQAVAFLKAMQETRRPHLFVWGMGGHSTRAMMPKKSSSAVMPIDIRLGMSLPAFTYCSLDDDPGTAAPKSTEQIEAEKKALREKAEKEPNERKRRHLLGIKPSRHDGDDKGQVNAYLYWETADIVDEENKWEVNVGLIDSAPKDNCTVDITPRRLQKLKAKAGQIFTWTNASAGTELQSGEVTADEHGLITLEKVTVMKAKNRISIVRKRKNKI